MSNQLVKKTDRLQKVQQLNKEEEHMTPADYCKRCNAPHTPVIKVFSRCGGCLVINGKLPPTKFICATEAKLKEKNNAT
jgi:hypothetical protein